MRKLTLSLCALVATVSLGVTVADASPPSGQLSWTDHGRAEVTEPGSVGTPAGSGTFIGTWTFAPGAATGWKGTDWIENIMLRSHPVELYDRWVAGDLPFTSPEVTAAFETLGQIWQDPAAVYGGSQMIALTPADQAVQFLIDDPPACWMHMQGSFVTSFFPDEVQSNLDEQVAPSSCPRPTRTSRRL